MVFETSFLITVENADYNEFFRVFRKLAKRYHIIELELEIKTETTIKTHKRGLSDD